MPERVIAAVENEVLPFMSNLRGVREAAAFAESMPNAEKSPHVQQARAYLLARAGDIRGASASIYDLLSILKLEIPWQAEMATRAQKLKELMQNNPADAEAQLKAWELESIDNLGLREIAGAAA